MANLKELKTRISSVKSTQKITSAMKMVAASRLKRAQEAAEAARPYAERMDRMVYSITENQQLIDGAPKLLVGNNSDDNYLFVLLTSDRGLCGGFNSNICREVRNQVRELEGKGKKVNLLCVGKKGRDQLKGEFAPSIVKTYEGIGRSGVTFSEAEELTSYLIELFGAGEFDVCVVIYNKFVSAITQVVTSQQVIPIDLGTIKQVDDKDKNLAIRDELSAVFEYEPSEQDVLTELLPSNLKTQIFHALLESSASEHGARMSAMDNATRNAGDMIDGLTLTFNRTRQAKITSELIEIISGAEAL
jgi:F-type H+-transporting ATPase subunit gamma